MNSGNTQRKIAAGAMTGHITETGDGQSCARSAWPRVTGPETLIVAVAREIRTPNPLLRTPQYKIERAAAVSLAKGARHLLALDWPTWTEPQRLSPIRNE